MHFCNRGKWSEINLSKATCFQACGLREPIVQVPRLATNSCCQKLFFLIRRTKACQNVKSFMPFCNRGKWSEINLSKVTCFQACVLGEPILQVLRLATNSCCRNLFLVIRRTKHACEYSRIFFLILPVFSVFQTGSFIVF